MHCKTCFTWLGNRETHSIPPKKKRFFVFFFITAINNFVQHFSFPSIAFQFFYSMTSFPQLINSGHFFFSRERKDRREKKINARLGCIIVNVLQIQFVGFSYDWCNKYDDDDVINSKRFSEVEWDRLLPPPRDIITHYFHHNFRNRRKYFVKKIYYSLETGSEPKFKFNSTKTDSFNKF